MVSNITSTMPRLNADGTLSAIVRDIRPIAPAGTLLRLWLPLAFDAGGGFGRYFLARCAEDTLEARRTDWSIYNRRALFCAAMPVAIPEQEGSLWELLVPAGADPGFSWLTRRSLNSSINLLGPFGQLFELASHTRTLVTIGDALTLPLLLPLVHSMLDRGGRVTLLLIHKSGEEPAGLLPLIPIPVEVRILSEEGWLDQLAEAVRWADQLCAALPNPQYSRLAYQLRTLRFQLDAAFAFVLVKSDLLCGSGACLACVVGTRDGGYTRSCVHGPVFPLATIA